MKCRQSDVFDGCIYDYDCQSKPQVNIPVVHSDFDSVPGDFFNGMGQHEPYVDADTVQYNGMIAEGYKKLTFQQTADCSGTAAAGAVDSC